MKNFTVSILVIMSLMFVSFSCTENSRSKSLLNKAEALSDTRPDSAVGLLDSIKNPQKLPKDEYMKYLVIRFKSKFKGYQDVSKDSLILDAADYYQKNFKAPAVLRSYAQLYAGIFSRENKGYEEAINYYLKANEYAEKTDSMRLKGLIESYLGDIYYKKNNYEKAIPYYKEALNIFSKLKNEETNQLIYLTNLASNYLYSYKYDSSLYYNFIALDLARNVQNKKYELINLTLIAQSYNWKNLPMDGLPYLHQAKNMNYNNSTRRRSPVYLNLSKAHLLLNNIDSSNYYIKLCLKEIENLEQEDDYLLLSTNEQLWNLREKEGNIKDAYNHHKEYHRLMQKIKNEDINENLIRYEKSYELSQKKKEAAEADYRAQTWLSVALGLAVILTVLALVIIILINKYQKEKAKKKLIDAQIEAQMEKVLFANKMYKFITHESGNFESQVNQLTYSYTMRGEKSDGYSKIQNMWQNMKKQTLDSLHKEAVLYLKARSMNESVVESLPTPDVLLLALSMCNYEPKQIAVLLNAKPHALVVRKGRLKEKLRNSGMEESEINKIF